LSFTFTIVIATSSPQDLANGSGGRQATFAPGAAVNSTGISP
jgi:hypothetical protein